uniref:Sushi domain-containing protein n=1 Tax=Sinocyclocheilus rhinocerous TaxID=307959 RepID=A0A673KBJ8_9TELE
MRVPVKLLGFGFWLFFLNCARCQECLREDIKYENTEPVEKASYADGETVKVNCITGYIGLYRLKCEKGEWKKSIERPCAKKKCSNPGDTPNGDFKLKEGTEFVFGATVVYTCKKGYEMTSRINQRTCRAQGWDNAVPVCEVVKCPAIRTDWEVTASGNTEEGRYGDVIHFDCVSSDKMIDGSSDIHCKETGTWSDAVPKCKGSFPFFYIFLFIYKKLGAIKSYSCETGYRKTAEEATCTRDGWTPKPLCAEMCAAPNIPNADIFRGHQQKYRIDSRIEYKCHRGFEPEEPFEIICDYQGQWTGLTAKSCPDLSVENGFTHSQSSNKEEIFYSCNTGYKPFTGNWWDSVTCSKGSWSDEPRCIRKEDCGALPSVHHGKLIHRDRETAEVECDPGFISTEPFIKCTNGRWETPVCKEDVRCGIPPNVENTVITSKPEKFYPDGSSLTYICRSSYFISGERTVSCHNGTWGKTPTCQDEGILKYFKTSYRF